jgi:hypothetical protein
MDSLLAAIGPIPRSFFKYPCGHHRIAYTKNGAALPDLANAAPRLSCVPGLKKIPDGIPRL